MATSKKKYGYNAKPRLSANQLAEYLHASSVRRRSIARDAKFPKTSVVARYDGAREGIVKFLCDMSRDEAILLDAVAALDARAAKATATDWTKEDCRLSKQAITKFQTAHNALGLHKLKCLPIAAEKTHLEFDGVRISVNLDTMVQTPSKTGGIILLISKSETSDGSRAERCKTAAVLAALCAEKYLSPIADHDPKLCLSVDVFGGKTYRAAGAYKARLANIKAACEEIATRWAALKPPADYDGPDPA